MKNFQRSFNPLVAFLRRLEDLGVLEEGQFGNAEKAIKALRHALKVGDIKRAHAAINDLIKVFLRGDR